MLREERQDKDTKLGELQSLLIKERGEKDTMIRTHQEVGGPCIGEDT